MAGVLSYHHKVGTRDVKTRPTTFPTTTYTYLNSLVLEERELATASIRFHGLYSFTFRKHASSTARPLDSVGSGMVKACGMDTTGLSGVTHLLFWQVEDFRRVIAGIDLRELDRFH